MLLPAQVTAVLLVAAGVLHFSAAGDHTDVVVMFAGFLAFAVLQVALGGLIFLGRASRRLALGGAALTLAALGLWALSRTSGIPYVPDGHKESLGWKDGVTVLFELGTLPGLVLLARRGPVLAGPPLPALRGVAVGTCALLVPALTIGGDTHVSHEDGPHVPGQVAGALHGHEADASSRVLRESAHGHGTRLTEEKSQDHSHSPSLPGSHEVASVHPQHSFSLSDGVGEEEHDGGDHARPEHRDEHDDRGGKDERHEQRHGNGGDGGGEKHGDGHGDGHGEGHSDHHPDPAAEPTTCEATEVSYRPAEGDEPPAVLICRDGEEPVALEVPPGRRL